MDSDSEEDIAQTVDDNTERSVVNKNYVHRNTAEIEIVSENDTSNNNAATNSTSTAARHSVVKLQTSPTRPELNWQTSNQYDKNISNTNIHFMCCSKVITIKATTREKLRIIRSVLTPFVIIAILILVLIFMFRSDIFFSRNSNDDNSIDPDLAKNSFLKNNSSFE